MTDLTDDLMLRLTYGAAYDYLTENPEFDGRPHPEHAGIMRTGIDPADTTPWPGVEDVHRVTREEWIAARLEAVRRGDERPALNPRT